ncbi:MAG: right-handed parallel beta-helix repeat-containing protein [Acidimicrobiales bacterium]
MGDRIRFGARGHLLRVAGLGATAALVTAGFSTVQTVASAGSSSPSVLLVGTYNGIAGQFPALTTASIQAAVNAAKPGDTILIAPGDYKTDTATAPAGAPQTPAAVLVQTPDISIIGLNRNTTIVDGTVSGPPCSTATTDQDFGPSGTSGPEGLNGIMIWKAGGVWVENLTACNFLAGSGSAGNEIWWNGGANSGQVDTVDTGYWGYNLTATSTYFNGESTAAQYGIFSSNWDGGIWRNTYASNFNDSGYYIGACQSDCNQVVDHAWAEYNALGYSGSNSGGNLVVKYSQFDNNQDGFDTNSQNGDNPPPQDGTCPGGAISPITHTTSCWVFMHNYVHDNNDPNVPTAGSAGAGPVGTGMSLSGARNDTIMNNTFANNDAWGTILVPYPDSGSPCSGGTQLQAVCIFDEYGDAVIDNTYGANGSFGNPTNGDIAAANLEPDATDCFSGNIDTGGTLSTSPPEAQLLYPTCTGMTVPPDVNPVFLDEVACDSGSISIGPVQGNTVCPPGYNYPRQTGVVMHALPGAVPGSWKGKAIPALENPRSAKLPSIGNAACGKYVPKNAWCPSKG